MINHDLSIFETDMQRTLGFLVNPVPMLFETTPSDESWALEIALEVGLTIEESNYRLFLDAQKEITDPGARQLLKELAEDILRHREQMMSVYSSLLGVYRKGNGSDRNRGVMDLRITDSLRDGPLSPDDTYQGVLIFAAKREKIGYDFFSTQARGVKDNSIRRIWESFAELKLGHKRKIESEYDDVVLREN